MNLIYITNIKLDSSASLGIIKKINGQINAFKKLSYNVDFCYTYKNKFIIENSANSDIQVCEKAYVDNILNTIRGKHSLNILVKTLMKNQYDVVYIRYATLDLGTLFFCKLLNRNGAKILFEIPTYPYMPEIFARYVTIPKKSIDSVLTFCKKYLVDFVIRLFFKKYVSFIILTIPKKSLWGIPVISIDNGIEFNKMPIRKKGYKENKNSIILFTATNIEVWQGLDRLVTGLHDYKMKVDSDYEIIVKIAGEGSEKPRLIELTRKYDLEKNFIFCGKKFGNDLYDLYNQADIAIGSLGRHRQNTNLVSTLKVKEYCAKAIPFIYSNDEPSLSGKEQYALKVPADNSPIDFNDIVLFYHNTKNSPHLINMMREISRNEYDWIHQIGKIDNQLKKFELK